MKTINVRSYKEVPACERCGRHEALVPIVFEVGNEGASFSPAENAGCDNYIHHECIDKRLSEIWCRQCADTQFARAEEPITRGKKKDAATKDVPGQQVMDAAQSSGSTSGVAAVEDVKAKRK